MPSPCGFASLCLYRRDHAQDVAGKTPRRQGWDSTNTPEEERAAALAAHTSSIRAGSKKSGLESAVGSAEVRTARRPFCLWHCRCKLCRSSSEAVRHYAQEFYEGLQTCCKPASPQPMHAIISQLTRESGGVIPAVMEAINKPTHPCMVRRPTPARTVSAGAVAGRCALTEASCAFYLETLEAAGGPGRRRRGEAAAPAW